MEEKKLDHSKVIDMVGEAIKKARRDEDNNAKNEFRNRLRQTLTSKWEQTHNETLVANFQLYAHDIEDLLYEVIKNKDK